MRRFVAMSIRARVCVLVTLTVACLTAGAMPATASAACGSGPGSCSQTDVNNAIDHGVSYLDANQNSSGSWGTTDPGAETALALASYGVLDGGDFNTLSAARKTIVEKGLNFLLGTQSSVNGSFAGDGLQTYDTGIALIALSLSSNVPTTPAGAVASAIAKARTYLVGQQQVPPQISCQSTGASGTGLGGQNFCGGWNYTTGSFGRSDESNTGFALTGLDVTGGVPAAVAAANVGWQRNVQQLTNNPGGFPARNDGGGAYEPGISNGDFSSNANDTGSLLFGYGYDNKVPASDPGVQAAIKFGTDVLNTYELNRSTRTMVYHTGQNEDGSCVIGAAACDWEFGTGEGGYHYSLFALVKGLSQYITPDLTDTTNFYAKAADLLIGQQGTDGSWPADLRDDASTIGATGFAILALGKVGIPVFPITAQAVPVSATEGKSFTGQVATFTVQSTTASASGILGERSTGATERHPRARSPEAPGKLHRDGHPHLRRRGDVHDHRDDHRRAHASTGRDRSRPMRTSRTRRFTRRRPSPRPQGPERQRQGGDVHRRRSERGALRLHRLDQLGRRAHVEWLDHRRPGHVQRCRRSRLLQKRDVQGHSEDQGQGRELGNGNAERHRRHEGRRPRCRDGQGHAPGMRADADPDAGQGEADRVGEVVARRSSDHRQDRA